MLVGSVTSFFIWRSPQREGRRFGLVIAGCVAGSGASLLGVELCQVIEPLACLKYYTYGNMRVSFVFDAFSSLFHSHFWVFAVQYLSTGLKYSFLNSDIHKWATEVLYFMLLPYLAY